VRIALISVVDDAATGVSSGEPLAALASALAAAGHDATVHLHWRRPAAVSPGVPERHHDLGAIAESLGAAWQSARPDLVHAFTLSAGLAALLAIRATHMPHPPDADRPAAVRSSPIPLVYAYTPTERPLDAGRRRLETALLRSVSAVTVPVGAAADDEHLRVSVPLGRLAEVPSGDEMVAEAARLYRHVVESFTAESGTLS
jgi:hypothetical protein